MTFSIKKCNCFNYIADLDSLFFRLVDFIFFCVFLVKALNLYHLLGLMCFHILACRTFSCRFFWGLCQRIMLQNLRLGYFFGMFFI